MTRHLTIYILLLLFSTSLLASEFNFKTQQESQIADQLERINGFPVKTGQIIVAESETPIALVYILLPKIYTPFMHAGIISIENGQIYVYDSGGKYHLSSNRPPTDTIRGKVRKRPWNKFIKEFGTVSLFMPPDTVQVNKVLEYAKKHAKRKTPFDAHFDYEDDSSLYCSEFVEKALQAGGNRTIPLTPFKANHSLQQLREWNKVTPAKGIIPVGSLIEPTKWVGTYSLDLSPSELIATRGTKLEIHNRFNVNQKAGSIFNWGTFGISYQQAVKDLFEHSKKQVTNKNIETFSTSLVQEQIAQIANNLYTSEVPKKQLTCSKGFFICQ